MQQLSLTLHPIHHAPARTTAWGALTMGATAALLGIALALLTPPSAAAQFVEDDVTVLTSLTAESAGDFFGWVAESAGDLDGDGAADYVITAPTHTTLAPLGGKAYVYSGATGTLLHTVLGERAFELLGFSVAAGGDVDADGVPDYAVGAPGFGGGPARVLILSGADHTVLHELTDGPGTRYGYDLHFAGDVDGDGHEDLLVGALLDSTLAPNGGRVDLVSGRDGSLLWTHHGSTEGGALGSAVTGLADLDGDGIPEQGAGAAGGGQPIGPDGVRPGEAFILDGATGEPVRTLRPNGTGGSFAQFFIHDAGDVDADGVGDVYVGDFNDAKGGRGYVFSGAADERLRLINAETPSDGLGMGRGAGDVDGDGHDDLLIGAFLSSAGARQGGRCWLVSGKSGRTLRTFTATVENAQVGFDVVRLGDVDGDSVTDWLLTGLDLAYVVAGTPR